MNKVSLSVQVFIGSISFAEAVKINQKEEPSFWNDMITNPYYADTWRYTDLSRGHVRSLVNETAYVDEDTSKEYSDYWFDVGSPNGDV